MLEYSLAVRLTHFFNFLFMTLLVRSGIEILAAHPKLYVKDDCTPGSEWLRFTPKRLRQDRPWTAEDEEASASPWIALPGRRNLGLGRHWHFWSVLGWVVCGCTYVVTLAVTSEWRRLVPTSWSLFPEAFKVAITYLQFRLPPEDPARYNALQQLAYFFAVFALTPLQIMTGLFMSPALAARFPRTCRLLGGRQMARSVHFLGLVAFVLFFLVHVLMVVLHGYGKGMARIALGSDAASHPAAIWLSSAAILLVIGVNVIGTRASLRHPVRTKRILELGVAHVKRLFFHHWTSRQDYQHPPSPRPRMNGRPPRNSEYVRSAAAGFRDWQLRIDGLVDQPRTLSLDELRALPSTTQSTLHVCIQGWSYYAKWKGVPLTTLLEMVHPQASARFLVFHTLDDKWEEPGHGYYYEVIDMEAAQAPQVILAYEMNGDPLPLEHGAPLRLRLEHQLGYKMVKWVNHIEFVEDFHGIGEGNGGFRNDLLHYYPTDAGI